MSKSIKIIVISTLSLGALTAIVVIWFVSSLGEFGAPPITNDYVVEFAEINSKIYIRARATGLTGDNEVIKLCSSPIDDAVTYPIDECLFIYGSEIYYKREGADTLRVFAFSSAVPKEYTKTLGSIKVEINEVKNYEELRDYAVRLGLLKASVSDNR